MHATRPLRWVMSHTRCPTRISPGRRGPPSAGRPPVGWGAREPSGPMSDGLRASSSRWPRSRRTCSGRSRRRSSWPGPAGTTSSPRARATRVPRTSPGSWAGRRACSSWPATSAKGAIAAGVGLAVAGPRRGVRPRDPRRDRPHLSGDPPLQGRQGRRDRGRHARRAPPAARAGAGRRLVRHRAGAEAGVGRVDHRRGPVPDRRRARRVGPGGRSRSRACSRCSWWCATCRTCAGWSAGRSCGPTAAADRSDLESRRASRTRVN